MRGGISHLPAASVNRREIRSMQADRKSRYARKERPHVHLGLDA